MSYVVEDRRRIAPHPAMPRTGEGRAVVAALKLGLVYRDKLTDVGSRDLRPGRQPRVECLARKAHVPRTDILTDVAPEQPVAHLRARSEEHTSELQSRRDLVCRLLLEKK